MSFRKTDHEKMLEKYQTQLNATKNTIAELEKKINDITVMGEFTEAAITTDCPLCANSVQLYNKKNTTVLEQYFDCRGICEHCGAEIRFSDKIGTHMMDKTKFFVKIETSAK